MGENFSSMYWIRKRVQHEELSEALRRTDRRKRKAQKQRERRKRKREGQPPQEGEKL